MPLPILISYSYDFLYSIWGSLTRRAIRSLPCVYGTDVASTAVTRLLENLKSTSLLPPLISTSKLKKVLSFFYNKVYLRLVNIQKFR